jgi:hypothetical protein
MEPGTGPRLDRWTVLGFVALAVIAGPVSSYTYPAFFAAMRFQTLTGVALSSAVAGMVLLLLGLRQRRLRGTEWAALGMLLLPQWLSVPLTAPYVHSISWLHGTPWGADLMLSVAAPLWLALLSALELVPVQVPRAVVGCAIAGVGAVFLAIPANAYAVAPSQLVVLTMHLLLNILTVFSWAFAAPRLAGVGTSSLAGWFLVLSAAGSALFGLVLEPGSWQGVDWRGVLGPLLVEAAVVAYSSWLWFWLLQRMTLAAFGMRALAVWTAALVPGFMLFGFMQWRLDLALGIALAAMVIALRARGVEEQPMALGLQNP